MITQAFSVFFLSLLLGIQASVEPPAPVGPVQQPADLGLTLILSCHYKGSLGRGDTFDCHVDEVTQGILSDKTITLGIPAGAYDGDRLASIDIRSGSVYGADKSAAIFLAHFKQITDSEHIPGIVGSNGFVSDDGRVRDMIDIQPAR